MTDQDPIELVARAIADEFDHRGNERHLIESAARRALELIRNGDPVALASVDLYECQCWDGHLPPCPYA